MKDFDSDTDRDTDPDRKMPARFFRRQRRCAALNKADLENKLIFGEDETHSALRDENQGVFLPFTGIRTDSQNVR